MNKDTKEKVIAYFIVAVIVVIGIGLYIWFMKTAPCESFLSVGQSPVRCLQ